MNGYLNFVLGSLLAWVVVAPQVTAPPTITVKTSPAEETLVKAAKENAESQEAYNKIFEQAKNGMVASNKTLTDQLTAAQKDLNEKLKADKHYKPMLDNIAAIQKKLQDSSTAAQTKFNQDIEPLQRKIQTNLALIDGLVPVVRKENDLPDTAVFDSKTQTWSVPKAPDKK